MSWTEESSTVFKVSFDEELWNMIVHEAWSLYGENPKRPTRFSITSKEIKSRLKIFRENFAELICEVPSVKGTDCSLSQTSLDTPYAFPVPIEGVTESSDEIEVLATEVRSALKEAYQICRRKASEVLVWLISDTERCYNPEIPHSLPVAYALKGYSLSTPIMRAMHNDILQECYKKQVNVVCSCFDGQWLKLATRDNDNKPLTLLQLQRDVWDECRRESREKIINYLAASKIIMNVETDLTLKKNQNGSFTVSCSIFDKILKVIKKNPVQGKDEKDRKDDSETQPTPDVLSTLPDDALDALFVDDELSSEIVNGLTQTVVTDTENTEQGIERVEQTEDESNENNERTTQKPVLTDKNCEEILDNLKSHQKKNIAKRWESKCSDDIKAILSNSVSLQKLTHDELNVVIGATSEQQKKMNVLIRKSWTLQEKCNGISRVIGDGVQIEKERSMKNMLTLKELAARKIRSAHQSKNRVTKHLLNLIFATLKYPAAKEKWLLASPFTAITHIEGVGPVQWFSYPEFSTERHKLEPKCLDAHHLLVNLRVKVCKDGLRGVTKKAWHDVAEYDRSVISKGLVVDLIDKQNNSFAQKTFSEEVAKTMRYLGYDREANFCDTVREWYEAEDAPGISAIDRTSRRLNMRQFLLRDVDFGVFPILGMYINGFTRSSFEGFLQKIDTNIQLHYVIKSGSYNQRSVSSLANETFFSELSDMDTTRLGCPKAVNIPRLMSHVQEIQHYRCDPSDR